MVRATQYLIVMLMLLLAAPSAPAAEFAGTRTTKVMGASQRLDPYKNFHFRLVFDSRTVGGFEEVSGLVAGSPNVARSGDTTPVQKIQGINKSTDVTLKRGVIAATDLESWLQSVKSPQGRKDVKIEVVDAAGGVSRVYFLHRSWIAKFKGPDLNGKGNDVAIEELVLGHEGIELLPPP